MPKQRSFCEYRRTNDVKQKKQKTENNSTPKENQITMFLKQKKGNVLRYLKKDPKTVSGTVRSRHVTILLL